MKLFLLAVFMMLTPFNSIAHLKPNPAFTPGVICTRDDPDFKEVRYIDDTVICKRHVTIEQRKFVASLYNIPWSEVHNYEFDHYIPLSLGGSNSSQNLWYQPWPEAHKKDALIFMLYQQLSKEKLTQAEAWAEILKWFDEE